jgi:hypothetical protein
MYSGSTVGISQHKNMSKLIHFLKFWKGGELELFWSGKKLRENDCGAMHTAAS